MRILIISKYFPPENSIASLRPHSWAKYWSRMGHEVEVLTTYKPLKRSHDLNSNLNNIKVTEVKFHSFYYFLERIYKKYLKKGGGNIDENELGKASGLAKKSKRNSLLTKIKNFRSSKGLFMAQRMPDTMDFWIQPASDWALKSGQWDLVISTFAPYSCHLIAYKMKKKGLVKHWIADFRDLWTDHHIYSGFFPFSHFEKYLERKIILNADVVTTVSQPLADTIQRNFTAAKVRVIENGFDSDELNDLPKEPYFKDDKVRILHTGTIYPGKQDPTMLFKVIAEIAADQDYASLLNNLEVLFVGANSEVVVNKAIEMGLAAWVKNGGFLPRHDILRMQREAAALLFLGFDKSKTPGILTGKLFEYLFSGTPIYALETVKDSAPGQLITNSNAGILFNEDEKMLKEYIIQLLDHPLKEKVQTNFSFLKNFERESQAYKMLNLVNDIKSSLHSN